jgi:hypothetical protein
MKSTKLALAGAAMVALIAGNVRAADAQSGASAVAPSISSLSTGTILQFPNDKAPLRIPAGERVPGFSVAIPKRDKADKATDSPTKHMVVVFASESAAKDFEAGKTNAFTDRGVEGTCFSERTERFDDDGQEWSISLEPQVNIMGKWKPPPPPPPLAKGAKPPPRPQTTAPFKPTYVDPDVTPIHQERFVDNGGKAQIEMTDAWVDPVTRGVRLIGKATLPLTTLETLPGGVTLYAARERDFVQVVARRAPQNGATNKPPSSLADFRTLNLARQPLIVNGPNGSTDGSRCSFARVGLRAQKGIAQSASIETSVVFVTPPAPPQSANADPTIEPGLMNALAKQEEDEVRVRPLKINASTTWMTRDKEAVFSLSLGWTGHERQM